MSDLLRRLPSVAAMERAAARRVPKFAFDYLQGGIGAESCLARNRAALDAVQLAPRYLVEKNFTPDLSTTLFGETYPLPFAPGPVGLSGLIWPNASQRIAAAATALGLPVGLSSFATASIEDIAAIAGEGLWFQLYCTADPAIEMDLIGRAEATGCKTLIVTLDIPTETRRERDVANGLSVPPRIDLATLLQVAAKPRWALETLRCGIPRFRSLERYVPKGTSQAESARFLTDLSEGHVTRNKLESIRKRWPHRLIAKGVLTDEDARACRDVGIDALVVSNHGGRQFDAAPTAPEVLPSIRRAVGDDLPLIADGSVRSGLDVARLLACGADFVLLGRAFVYAVAAAGDAGPDHAFALLREELRHSLAQCGCPDLKSLTRHRHQTEQG